MEECVLPYAVFELEDEMSATLKSRGVRAALAKHREALAKQYAKWSGTDLGPESGGAGSMSLGELTAALKAAKVLDDKCTVKEVTTFFVRINADDEVYVAERNAAGKAGAAELDFDEFCEVIARICSEKMPPEPGETRDDLSFAMTLDTWLGLFLIPALRNASVLG